ncbi:MAG: Flp family type IVb pilin [Nitrospirota bacterium]|nr:Flp family type IVb pilin [Nitrospirota bacterium]
MGQFFHDEQGAVAIEYSLLMSLIGIVIATALHVLGVNLIDAFSSVSGALTPVQVIDDPRNGHL